MIHFVDSKFTRTEPVTFKIKTTDHSQMKRELEKDKATLARNP